MLDLDQAHPYVVTAEGNRIVLTIEAAAESLGSSRGAPVAATSGNLIALFRRHTKTRLSSRIAQSAGGESLPAPPPTRMARDSSRHLTDHLWLRFLLRSPVCPAESTCRSSSAGPAGQTSFDQNQIASAKAPRADCGAASDCRGVPSRCLLQFPPRAPSGSPMRNLPFGNCYRAAFACCVDREAAEVASSTPSSPAPVPIATDEVPATTTASSTRFRRRPLLARQRRLQLQRLFHADRAQR